MDNLEIYNDEEKVYLLNSIEKSYRGNEKLFLTSYEYIKTLDSISFSNEKDKVNSKLIADFYLFQSINLLEVTLAFKNYLTIGATYFERFCAMKNIIILLNEGYKKMFHFYDNKRNSSIWKSKVGKVVDENLTSQKKEFELLTGEIIKYQDNHQSFILKTQRSKFLHYEEELFDYVEEMIKIDTKEIIINSVEYIQLNIKLNKFAIKLFNELTKNREA